MRSNLQQLNNEGEIAMNVKKLSVILIVLFCIICLLSLVSCVPSDNGDPNGDGNTVKTYTVTWKNYNGDVLKVDEKVKEGAVPVYDGATPARQSDGRYSYVFAGWTPQVAAVSGNVTYTAVFNAKLIGEPIAGVDPVLSDNGKTVKYGFYPQTHISDESLIAQLNELTPSQTNGWFMLDGEYYVKSAAKVYNNENYTFDDGTAIVNGTEYWFKCEVIEWRVLSAQDGTYYLLSDKLLDAHNYYADYANRTDNGATVYSNNYAQSEVRKFLNGSFYDTAFALNNAYVKATAVDNGAETTSSNGNLYACLDTTDKVYLPSYADYLNARYGFHATADETSQTRESKTTDYARARGAWYNTASTLEYNGSYWTRSPSDVYAYCAWNVNSGGVLSAYAVDGASHCARPCITIGIAQ